MKVNLKKASALAAAVSAVMVKFDHQYAVDVYADITPGQVKKLNETLDRQVQTALGLSTVVYEIRTLIGKANEDRVNALLTQRALVEKQIALLNTIPVRETGTNFEALARQIVALRAGEKPPFLTGSPKIELETSSLVTPLLRSLRKSKRAFDEELQAVNFTTNIELPVEVVKVLTELDLI